MNHLVLTKGWEKVNTGLDGPWMPKNEIYLVGKIILGFHSLSMVKSFFHRIQHL